MLSEGYRSNRALDALRSPPTMVHRNMNDQSVTVRLRDRLEDLAAEIGHARKGMELGHLAALCFCEVRPWARRAGEGRLADLSWRLSIQPLPLDRTAFLAQIDRLIEELEQICTRAGIGMAAATLRQARAEQFDST